MPKQIAAVACWDFYFNSSSVEVNDLPSPKDFKKILRKHSKKWIFQLEKGAGGRFHYQVRISLKDKVRNFKKLEGLNSKYINEIPTCSENMNQFGYDSYQAKDDHTRVEGPWAYNDPCLSRDFALMGIHGESDLRPWQKSIIEKARTDELRKIIFIYDPQGNQGKSVLFKFMGIMRIGKELPMCNDFQSVMRMAYDVGEFPCYMIDMPRAMKKEKLFGLFSGIEKLKGGYAYDDRNTFRDRYFMNPAIIVASNKMPDMTMLTGDRWDFYSIEENELVKSDLGAVAENPSHSFS